MQVNVIGAGLAGCEAALWLADAGVQVDLYEQKPGKFSPAHKSAGFAELICSNSLKAMRINSAAGLLKAVLVMIGTPEWAGVLLPQLTCIERPEHEMAEASASLLLNSIKTPDRPATNQLFRCVVKAGQSVLAYSQVP